MYSNLTIAVAQEHHRDLRREATAAKLARSAAVDQPAVAAPRSNRISFMSSVRRAAHKFAVRAAEPPRLA
jgi:hypothetical protein